MSVNNTGTERKVSTTSMQVIVAACIEKRRVIHYHISLLH